MKLTHNKLPARIVYIILVAKVRINDSCCLNRWSQTVEGNGKDKGGRGGGGGGGH